MTSLHNAKYHILAILTVAVWGTTFISTKVLIMGNHIYIYKSSDKQWFDSS